MFPGRFPAASDNMWAFWNPQAMGLQGQFCGSDLMGQQSQAQLQAQNQAQLAALREQNNMLHQQLGVQAQTHIQHLQQLLPFHQSTFHPHQTQSPAPVPDPPTPVATQSTPPAPSASFNAEEMIQQMKNTVESSMQAFVDKTQERNLNQQPPAPTPPPVQTAPPIPIYPSPPLEVPPPLQQPQRRSRSRSHRHHGAPDKRPISIPRSPRRASPLRRTYRSSRPRSAHSRRRSMSRNPSRRPSRASSVHLRSASPRRREVRQDYDVDFYHEVPSREPASLHPASWEYQQYPQDPPTYNEYYQNEYSSYEQPSTHKWKSWNQWKDTSQSKPRTHASGWIDYPKHSYKPQRHHDSSTKPSNRPLTAFSSDRPHKNPHRSSSIQSRVSTNAVPPGHVPINLQDCSKEEWARHVVHALHHPDRMRAANELKPGERPEVTTSMPQDAYDAAKEQLHQVDARIPNDIVEKAIQLFFSTNLLPEYDLSTCYVRELPNTSMLALVMPLPSISRFSMPTPFGNQHSHTWALCHGTTFSSAQLILLEGKIRPANWTYHKNPQKCHLPTFGAYYLGREISNADTTIPTWMETILLDSIEKKAKGQQGVTVGTMFRGAYEHTRFQGGGNEKAQVHVAEKGVVNTSEKYTIAHSNHVGLHFIALKWADLKGSRKSEQKTKEIDLRDSESDDCTYRGNEERRRRR